MQMSLRDQGGAGRGVDDLPPELRSAVESAAELLAQSPEGRLPLGARRRIYALLGPETRSPDGRPSGIGYRRRVLLDVLAAQRALAVWDRAHSGDRRPQRMLLLANGVVRGTVDRQAAEREQGDFSVDVGNESSNKDPGPGLAGGAAAQTVLTALVDRHGNDLGAPEFDEQIDPDVWPAEYMASEATAFATPGEENVEQRRAFWTWFLTEAVPAAYFADSVTADQG